MPNKRIGAIWLLALMILVLTIPGLLVKKSPESAERFHFQHASQRPAIEDGKERPVVVPVFLTAQKKVEYVPLEDYVKGVLAAEMPIEFELEALKAQAMAARSYIVRRLMDKDHSNVPVEEAIVTDSVAHQAFATDQELKRKWEEQYTENMKKINRAVTETKNMVLTHEGLPIYAAFFSTSNGYTENSEEYWTDYVPYLRSVPSPWDAKYSPKYKEEMTVDYKEVLRKLGVNTAADMRVLEKTKGNRIKKILIGNHLFSGREVRERLGLNSSQFEWTRLGDRMKFVTYGYGHGVGMSQWGANGMAKEGKTAEQIVKHYYTGIEISSLPEILKENRKS